MTRYTMKYDVLSSLVELCHATLNARPVCVSTVKISDVKYTNRFASL